MFQRSLQAKLGLGHFSSLLLDDEHTDDFDLLIYELHLELLIYHKLLFLK